MQASFPPRADSIAAARRFVRQAMVELRLEALVDDAVLIASELATNAVVHAGTPFEVTCVDLGAGTRIEVHDRHAAKVLPAPLPDFDPTREGGRGLLACSALASAWGVEYTRTGKTVWCRLDLTEPDRAPEQPADAVRATRVHNDPVPGRVLVGVIGTDLDDRVRGWNADATELLGWTADQVVGSQLAALRDHTADLDTMPDVAAGRWQGELDLRHRDGHFVSVFVSRLPYTDGPGGPQTGWLVVPSSQRAVLEDLGATEPQADTADVRWAAFSRSELTRLPLDELLSRTVQRACDAIDGDAAYLVLFDDDGGDGYISASTGLAAAPHAATEGSTARISIERLPAVHDDLAERPVLPGLVGTTMRSAVSVPLVVETRLIGQLVVASTTPGGFGNHDASRMQQAADQLALSIESCRIAELARRHRGWLGYLADASDLLAGTLDPQMTLAVLAQLMVPRLASWCVVTTTDIRDRVEFSHVWHRDETRIDDLRAMLDELPPDARTGGGSTPEPVRGTLHGEATLRLPLRARGRGLGAVLIGDPPGGRFDQAAVELASELARRAALTLDNALLYRNQHAASEALQRSLQPNRLPTVPHLEVGATYHAAGQGQDVGGDFYDLFTVAPDRWRFTIGDVCGSGPEAAAVTGQARHILRLLGRQRCPVPEAVGQLNDSVYEDGGPAPFLTLLHGEITPRDGGGVLVELVSAGHPLPYLLDPSGQARPVGSHQPLLGVLADRDYRSDTVPVLPGQSLLCLTDGVLERRRDGRMLGEHDLDALLADCRGLSAAAMATAVRRVVDEYSPIPTEDDIAVLVLRAVPATDTTDTTGTVDADDTTDTADTDAEDDPGDRGAGGAAVTAGR